MTKRIRVQERTERRISAALSITMCVVAVLAEIALSIFLAVVLQERAAILYVLLGVAAAIVAIWIYGRPGSPSYKLAWMCLVLLLPAAGLFLFYLWGGDRQSKTLSMKSVPLPAESPDALAESRTAAWQLGRQSPAWERLARYLQKQGFLLYGGSQARYLNGGAAYFDDLTAHLARAERYIFLEYYILAEGQIWDRLLEILKERAAAGVEVRVIFDDFGNLSRFSDRSLQAMQDAGIHAAVFNPVHKYVNRIYFNFRDHRKIAVIDGIHAYTGGINIGDEYANLTHPYGHWKDNGVRIDGAGAWGFAAQFIQMWKRLGGTFTHSTDFYRPRETLEGTGWCQPFTDGPDRNPDTLIEETYLQLIHSARRTLYITTPYYAVEESMQQALCIAADAGVDVRLLMPAVPDHKAVYMVAETYWGELIRHGVRVYRYTPGFLHAKSVLADGEVALIGSTNMDYRTFQLHYECGVLLYHMPLAEDLRRDMERIMEASQLCTLQDWNRRPWYRRIAASVLKLAAIWL